ncbi:hypothetical protein [Granulicella sp. S156]|uniref:hypothetical protein n=1 Tax=Granulicella sp. S156 TaxID=1747224 RepID=UPI00131AA059|nr:hypothetical protein [Granulicella sp. S156]
MTFNPGFSRSNPQPMQVEKLQTGLYSVKNAYSGDVEYFKGRPLPKIAPSKASK